MPIHQQTGRGRAGDDDIGANAWEDYIAWLEAGGEPGVGEEEIAAQWEDRAWREARSGPRFQPAQRTCLGPLCRGQVAFASTHAGNRLCERCRTIEDTPTDRAARLYGLKF